MSALMEKGLLCKMIFDKYAPGEKLIDKDVFFVCMCFALCAVVGYLIGSLNFGVIISRIYGADIRTKGSGNAGATNMMRVYGKKASYLTFLGDVLKTVVAVFLCRILIAGFNGAYFTGLFVIIGHAFPLYFKFKGGKGVACIAAFCLCTTPIIFLIELVIFIAILFAFKMVSLGSIMIALIFPYMLYLFEGPGLHVVVGFLAAAMVIFLHRQNLVRIFNHTEHKFNLGRKKKQNEATQEKVEQGSDQIKENDNEKNQE
ncbi:MAG: glycerol-3-phosphate 1-O-acyltransferase PlsY [Clostridia bacterium]|nr:glycerol-3-phosphate 1-O-acyltransferase PlsY [Clostridia bacterium]